MQEDFSSLCNQLTNVYEQFGSQFLKFDYFEEFQTIQLLEDINYVKHFKHQDSDYLLINEQQSCLTHLMKLKTNSGFVERDLENPYTGVISQIEVISGHDELFLVARMMTNCEEDLNFDVVWKFIDEDLHVSTYCFYYYYLLMQKSGCGHFGPSRIVAKLLAASNILRIETGSCN